jgi:hypothetical protein
MKTTSNQSTKQPHNQTVARNLKIKSNVKAGGIRVAQGGNNHNQSAAKRLKVRSSIKAGTILLDQ